MYNVYGRDGLLPTNISRVELSLAGRGPAPSFTACLASNCVHITNFCQCYMMNRSNMYHFQDRVFKNLLGLLHLLFFPWFLLHIEDSEVLKTEPQNERIWAPVSQVKVIHSLARTLALNS